MVIYLLNTILIQIMEKKQDILKVIQLTQNQYSDNILFYLASGRYDTNIATAVVKGKLYIVNNDPAIYTLKCHAGDADYYFLQNLPPPFNYGIPLAAEWNGNLFFCIRKLCGMIDISEATRDQPMTPLRMADLNDDHSGGKMQVVNGKLMVFGSNDVTSAKAEYFNWEGEGQWEKVAMPSEFPVGYEGFSIAEGPGDNVHFFSGFGYDESNFMRVMNFDFNITLPEPVTAQFIKDMYQYSAGANTLTISNAAPNPIMDITYEFAQSGSRDFASIGGNNWIVHHRTNDECVRNGTFETR